jgi:hypothetical protein
MKKWQVALLVVAGTLVVLVVGAGTAFYVMVYKPLVSANMYVGVGERLESRITKKAPYDPPADGRLTADQVTRFLAVRERVEARLGSAAATARAEHDALMREPRGPTSRAVRAALGNIGGAYMQAKQAQFEAFNDVGFSKAEYEWVRARVYPAAGLELVQLRVREILDDPGNLDHVVGITRHSSGAADPRDRALVEPYRSRLARGLVLEFFDL